ncbi:MAG: 3'(2'),5'-bisphosphate nucleotidase CysQ [Sphingomonas sp. 28-66-16]|nr:MAG: 3'(2'),5'-bisphosphate nucleotidase CysQ [Sphingomonas sp. 28-66-16]
MSAVNPATLSDHALARSIAEAAAALLRDVLARADCSARILGDRGDRQANRLILDWLHRARPDDFILSEESPDDGRRCAARRVWIIDPLDGTREFSDGLDDWAVHIGLAVDGVPQVGAVALPARGRLFASDDPVTPLPPHVGRPRIVVSRTRPPAIAGQVAEAIGGDLVPMGSAGAKAMAVLAGDAEIYLHDGGQYEWDNCAPAAVVLAAGLHASRIDGAPLVYNCADPAMPDLLICRREWAGPVLAALGVAVPPGDASQ